MARMTRMGLMQNAKCKMQNEEFLSVKSVKSAVKFLWLRLCRAAPMCGQFRIGLRLAALGHWY
jgi:hypothetical protein